MKLIGILSFVILTILSANCAVNKAINLGGDGAQYFKMNYLNNTGVNSTYIEFEAHLNKSLGYNQTATAICINKQSNATDVQKDDDGFGIMFACYLPGGCSDGTKLHGWFCASFLESISPPTWANGGEDYSSNNTGVLYVGNGTDFDTTYKLSPEAASNLTIPSSSENPEYRCYFNFLGNETATRIDK